MTDFSELREKEELFENLVIRGKLHEIQFWYYAVYSLINKTNGKRYIGRTKNPKLRIYSHYISIKNGTHYNPLIQQETQWDFDYEILEDHLSQKEAKAKERYYMMKFKTYDYQFGYNVNDHMMKNVRISKEGES